MKPIEARQIEARSRARMNSVRVREVLKGNHYTTQAQSDSTTTYFIDRTARGWRCSCKGFEFTNCCKHVAQVERRSEREGWAFGKVAPR